MDTTLTRKPKTLAELLPDMSGILTEHAKLTAKKKNRPTMVQKSLTAEKVVKPMNIAEILKDIKAFKIKSPKQGVQAATSSKKRWNSSVKVDKTINIRMQGKLKTSAVRKVLDFQSKPVVQTHRALLHSEAPEFLKPEVKTNKSILKQAHNTVRISGICNMPESPDIISKPQNNRTTIANKENINDVPPKSAAVKVIVKSPPVPDTPLTNDSYNTTCDGSFLKKEQEINDTEQKILTEKNNNVTPQVSTPFTHCRSLQEYFDNSNNLDDSAAYRDNTIMCFDKSINANNKREDSVIVSLCDLLNKATVTDVDGTCTLSDLLNLEKQIEQNSKMIENTISMLNELKKTEMKSLRCIRKLIQEKKNTVEEKISDTKKNETPKNIPVGKPCSVIKSCVKSPVYKIPKKSPCLKKIVIDKAVSNRLKKVQSPNKNMGTEALNMYMDMKQHLNFLNTPLKRPGTTEPNTPAVTSHNLQVQLERLYGES